MVLLVSAVTGTATHVGDGALQQNAKLLLFFWGKACHDALLIAFDGLMHQVVALLSLGKNKDSLTASVIGVSA